MNPWALWAAASSALILVVVLSRAIMGKRLRAGARYALWGLVLLRLLVPTQLFAAPVLDAGPAETPGQQETARTETSQAGETPGAALSGTVSPGDASDVPQGGPQDDFPGERPGNTQTASPNGGRDDAQTGERDPNPGAAPEPGPDIDSADTSGREPASLGTLLLRIWLGGAVAAGLVLLGFNLRFTLALRRERRPIKNAEGRLPAYVLEGLSSPCLFGVFRPAVYVSPKAAGEPRMLRHVLYHEETHYRHGDHIWSLLRCAALAIHWWNPLVWLAVSMSRRDGELFCDQGALKRLGDGERNAYGSTLLTLVTAGPSALMSCATAMSGGKRALRERISRIAVPERRRVWAAALALAVTLSAAACSFAEPVERPRDAEPSASGPADSDTPDEPDKSDEPDEPDEPIVFNGYVYDGGDTDRNGRPLSVPLDNAQNYSWLNYTGKEGGEAAPRAARELLVMFLADLRDYTYDRSFSLFPDDDTLKVSVFPTLDGDGNPDVELQRQFHLFPDEIGEDKWVVTADCRFSYSGIMGGGMGVGDPFTRTTGLMAGGESAGFLLTREEDMYYLQSRLRKLKYAGVLGGEPGGEEPEYIQDLRDVLLNKRDFRFISANGTWEEKLSYNSTEHRCYLKDINRQISASDLLPKIVPARLTALDMDLDGRVEAVLWLGGDYGYLVLRWEDGEVYGYYRWTKAFKELNEFGLLWVGGTVTSYPPDMPGAQKAQEAALREHYENYFYYFTFDGPKYETTYLPLGHPRAKAPGASWSEFSPENIEIFVTERALELSRPYSGQSVTEYGGK